jgi:hypothetical protein
LPTEIIERGEERWEIKPKSKILQWLIGSFDLIDRRRKITASEIDELIAIYEIEAEEREKAQREISEV